MIANWITQLYVRKSTLSHLRVLDAVGFQLLIAFNSYRIVGILQLFSTDHVEECFVLLEFNEHRDDFGVQAHLRKEEILLAIALLLSSRDSTRKGEFSIILAMDCTRNTVFPYDNNEGVYGEISAKYTQNVGSYFRNIPFGNQKGYSSPLAFGKSSLSGDAAGDITDGSFPFSHGEPLASDKCHFPGEHYLHSTANSDFSASHGGHGYLRLPGQEARYIQPSTDIYQSGNHLDSFGSMVNGTVDHFPHTVRSLSSHFYSQDVKFSPEALANQLAHDFGKFGPYGHGSSYPSHRYGPSADYTQRSYYGGSGSTMAAQHTSGCSISSSMPPVAQNTSPLLPTKLPGNILSRNSLTPTGTLSKDSDVEQVDETHKCKNTIEGTKTSVRRFKKWYREKYSKSIDMNTINKFTAPELLKDFFTEIRDTRPGRVGNEYEPVTLTTYRNGLRRYFLYRKVPPAPDNFDLTDKTFDIVNRRLMTKRDDLKRKGKGNHPNAIESITPEQLDKMWASGAIGIHAPRPLLRLQWWLNTVFHGIRGRMAHHDLSIEDFRLTRGPDGKLCVEYIKGMDRLNGLKTEPRGKRRGKGRIFETDGGERDPVRAFETYKAHRPPSIGSFYLTPKQKPKGNIWFNKVPMGKNSIGRIMREIKAIAGIN